MTAMADTAAVATQTLPTASAAVAAGGSKWLLFAVGSTEYGVDIGSVQQIIGLLPITRIPRMPDAVRGVINLRGRVIPVVDLRIRFGLDAVDQNQRTCIIVVRSRAMDLGLVVDSVAEVAVIDSGGIDDPPQFGNGVDTEYLLGVAQYAGRVVLLLDVERALPLEMTGALKEAAGPPAV